LRDYKEAFAIGRESIEKIINEKLENKE